MQATLCALESSCLVEAVESVLVEAVESVVAEAVVKAVDFCRILCALVLLKLLIVVGYYVL